MRYNKIKQRLIISLLLLLLVAALSLSCVAQSDGNRAVYHWYVRRNAAHKQPQADEAQALFEKYDAYYVDKKHGDDCVDKVLYLTFDAGYENGNVTKILDVLKEENVPAAFFVLKNIVVKEDVLLDRMVKEGHLVCNHTQNHKDMTQATEDAFAKEIEGLAALYHEKTGEEMPHYYRPPEGKYSEENLRCAQKMGYKTVFWSFAYADWDNDKQPDLLAAKKKVLENTHNGAVLLLHPTSATNAAILQDLIRIWKAEGYRFGTLDELTAKA